MKIESRTIDNEIWFKFNNEFERIRYFYSNLLTFLFICLLVILGIGLGYIVFNNINLLKTSPCSLCEDLGYFCMQKFGG